MSNQFFKPTMFLKTVERDIDGNIVKESPWTSNQLVNTGKMHIGHLITSLVSGGFQWLCFGASGTPAISVDDDRLGGTQAAPSTAHEYIGNAARKKLVSVLTDTDLDISDWVEDDYTDPDTDVEYTIKCDTYVVLETTDGNNGAGAGNPIVRYGLNNHSALPTVVTGKSGTMMNEIIHDTINFKKSTNTITVFLTLRL